MPITRSHAPPHWTLPWDPPSVPSQTRSDDELLLLVGAGDHRAFASLYDHLAGLVYANIRRVVQDAPRTDDVAEEAFIEVWRRAARFDPLLMTAASWILGLAHQLAVERVHKDLATQRDARVVTVRTPSRGGLTQLRTVLPPRAGRERG